MIFRNLDQNGDWEIGAGKGNYLAGNPAIGLNIKTRILSWIGDCFFAPQAGIDWTNRLGTKGQRSLLEMDLRRIILQSYGVTGIIAFSTDVIGRSFNASYTVSTIFSTLNGSVSQDI